MRSKTIDDINKMSSEEKTEALYKCFEHMRNNVEIISQLNNKIRELGGDPHFFLSQEQKEKQEIFVREFPRLNN